MGPQSDCRWPEVARIEAVLRAHPGWYVRYDGTRDRFVAGREGGVVLTTAFRLSDLLDAIEEAR